MLNTYDEDSNTSQSVPYQMPMHNQGSNILFMTDPSEDIELIKWNLKGYEKTETGWNSISEPLMNDVGVNTVIDYVSTIVSRNTMMSRLDKKDIEAATLYLSEVLAKDLMNNRDTYGIKSFAVRDRIYWKIINHARFCMKRALDQSEKNFWSRIQQDITTTVQGKQGKGNMVSKFFGWGK